MTFERFEITEDHLKLLNVMYVSWNNCEFGAPTINCKRPYGDSSVESDIAEILDWNVPEYGELTDEQIDKANQIHNETERVLQICLSTLSFKVGMYEKEGYRNNWKLISE